MFSSRMSVDAVSSCLFPLWRGMGSRLESSAVRASVLGDRIAQYCVMVHGSKRQSQPVCWGTQLGAVAPVSQSLAQWVW